MTTVCLELINSLRRTVWFHTLPLDYAVVGSARAQTSAAGLLLWSPVFGGLTLRSVMEVK